MDPNRRAQAIRRFESASFSPKDDIGTAYKKSKAFSDDTASSRAFSFGVGAEHPWAGEDLSLKSDERDQTV